MSSSRVSFTFGLQFQLDQDSAKPQPARMRHCHHGGSQAVSANSTMASPKTACPSMKCLEPEAGGKVDRPTRVDPASRYRSCDHQSSRL